MPINLRKHLDMKEIFNACVGDVNDCMIFQKRPLWVKENAAFILDQNTCRIRHPFDLQANNIARSFKLSDKVRFYECTRNVDGLFLSTEVHVIKERNNLIGGIASSQNVEKWCEQDAELEHVFALFRKWSDHIETKKQGKKYVREICFFLSLQAFNKYDFRLSRMESFSLTYSRMVVRYSGHPESSVSNQSINCPLRRYQIQVNKLLAQLRHPIEHSFRKELQQKI